jgi:hypothetical protein
MIKVINLIFLRRDIPNEHDQSDKFDFRRSYDYFTAGEGLDTGDGFFGGYKHERSFYATGEYGDDVVEMIGELCEENSLFSDRFVERVTGVLFHVDTQSSRDLLHEISNSEYFSREDRRNIMRGLEKLDGLRSGND